MMRNGITTTEFAIQIVLTDCGAFSMLGAFYKAISTLEQGHKRIDFYIQLMPNVNVAKEIELIKSHFKNELERKPSINIYSLETYKLHHDETT